MFQQDSINVPVLGIVKYGLLYSENCKINTIFGENGAKNLAADLSVPFLGELPIVQSIRGRRLWSSCSITNSNNFGNRF